MSAVRRRIRGSRPRDVVLWTITMLSSAGMIAAIPLTRMPESATVNARPAVTSTTRAATKRTTTTTTSTTTSVAPSTTRTTTTPRRVAIAPLANCAGVVAAIVWPPSWQVVCAGPRPGLLGSTDPSGVTTLFVREGEAMTWLRIVALHESGHAWDLARLDGTVIARWCAARGCDAPRFFSGGASVHEPGGGEDWAAVWDACHGGEYDRSYLGLPAPTAAQCALQDTLARYPARPRSRPPA
jgi:hypothetical protein